jgi:hypothetical protein
VPMGNDYTTAITYQPYLLLKTDGIVPRIYVIDSLNRTIADAQVYVSKYIGGVLTVTESGYTFSNGAYNFSAYPLDIYYITVYYDGVLKGVFSVQPRESTDTFYIQIDRTTPTVTPQNLLISMDSNTSRYQNRDTNIVFTGTITSNLNYITDYNVNMYERGNLVYSTNVVATSTSIAINKTIDVNLVPDYIHNARVDVIVDYTVNGATESRTFSRAFIISDSQDVLATVTSAKGEIGQPLCIFIAIIVTLCLIAFLVFSGVINDPSILAVFGVLSLGVFMFIGFLDIGVVIIGIDIGRFVYFLGAMATLYFAFFGGSR